MDPNFYRIDGHAPPSFHSAITPHINPNFMKHWNQQQLLVRPNVVHVNPAFIQQSCIPQVEPPNTTRVFVNPNFLNQAKPNSAVVKENPISIPTEIQTTIKQATLKPSPIPHYQPAASLLNKRKIEMKLHLSPVALKNQYKWKKVENSTKPISTSIKNSLYKLVRKAPSLKSPKLSTLLTLKPRFSSTKWLSPPKMASTPNESSPAKRTTSRFKLDNRKKTKAVKRTPTTPKQQTIREKYWRPAAISSKWFLDQRTSFGNRSFTNFKSTVSRPQHRHLVLPPRGSRKLQRLVAAVKPVKNSSTLVAPKKKKTPTKAKTKGRKRYYDEEGPSVHQTVEDSIGDDVEIAVKPSGSKKRAPIGDLPSFITL